MSTVLHDELHRLVKLVMDTGEAESIEHAQHIFMGYRIGIIAGPEITESRTHRAALLTLLKLAKSVFLGGVEIQIQCAMPDILLLPEIKEITNAMQHTGAKLVNTIDSEIPIICLGTVQLPSSSRFAIRAIFSGWRAGIVPITLTPPFKFEEEFPLSGALSAALAINEAFLFVRKDTQEAGYREVGISLWRPEVISDWWKNEYDGPRLSYLPNKLWLIGLGHLGQAYLWALSLLPYTRTEDVELVLQDFDMITQSTLSTSILSDKSMIGEKKTRAMSAIMEARGFKTAILERKFDGNMGVSFDEPRIALCGVDNILARRALCDAGFDYIVEAGLGSGISDFRAIRIHTFPSAKSPKEIWKLASEELIDTDIPVYQNLKTRGLDQCGLTLLAGKAIGAPFVGMVAASLVLTEVLRLLHGGTRFTVHDINLKSPSSRVSVESTSQEVPINPGFITL